jgi:predicted nucleotidyltransferase component of viral defense system
VKTIYRNQVKLILQILPEISKIKDFALHGGTALNLFYHDMPRLSVDIDLTYLPFGDRDDDLVKISDKLNQMSVRLTKINPSLTIKYPVKVGDDLKLICSAKGTMVKVEVNLVNRGINENIVMKPLCKKAQSEFDSFCEVQIVPESQLFGGKIVATLDRQHPRDLFDIKKMLETIGYSEQIHNGFLFCLMSSNRPFHEILKPIYKDQRAVLEGNFTGMSDEVFTYDMFESAREEIINLIHFHLSQKEREFLMSFTTGNPIWLGEDLSRFPGINWKLLNINKLKQKNFQKFKLQLEQLESTLYNKRFE